MISNYNNPLPGVPDVESPFFRELFDPADEFYQVAKDLNERGFAVLDFPDPDFDEIAAKIKRDLGPLYPWANWFAGDADMRQGDMWQSNAEVRRIATNPRVRQILTYLYGRECFPFQTLNFATGTQQHYHTDSVHFSARPERFMCGVWVAFEDVGPDQGPLIYYPGSHKWPIYTREHIGRTYRKRTGSHQEAFQPMWERLVEVSGVQPERFLPRKGQMLIWASNLLHGGDLQTNRRLTRWSQVTHYYFENCSYYTPLASNEPMGEIHHRRPFNIVTGNPVDCFYNGEVVPDSYLEVTIPGSQGVGEFDDETYLRLHPDVAASGADPWTPLRHVRPQ